jgi:hypothetical protein
MAFAEQTIRRAVSRQVARLKRGAREPDERRVSGAVIYQVGGSDRQGEKAEG